MTPAPLTRALALLLLFCPLGPADGAEATARVGSAPAVTVISLDQPGGSEEDALESLRGLLPEGLDAAAIRRMHGELERGEAFHGYKLWAVLILLLWHRG